MAQQQQIPMVKKVLIPVPSDTQQPVVVMVVIAQIAHVVVLLAVPVVRVAEPALMATLAVELEIKVRTLHRRVMPEQLWGQVTTEVAVVELALQVPQLLQKYLVMEGLVPRLQFLVHQ